MLGVSYLYIIIPSWTLKYSEARTLSFFILSFYDSPVQVAVPILVARILTYPERVSHHNIEKLRQCVRNGPNKYPGAKFIKQPGADPM